jgi:ABC-type amino acid transport substrate-binding protein
MNRLLLRKLIAAVLCIVAVGLFFWQWRRLNPRDPALIRLENEHRLIIGIDPSFPPFASIQNDHVVGFDAEFAQELGRRLGAEVNFRVLGYDGLYDALRVGEADALISAQVFDPGKLGDFNFSLPYFDNGTVIVSRTQLYPTLESLNDKSVAFEQGTRADELARLWSRRLKILNLHPMQSASAALDLAASGGVDAALVDYLTVRSYLKTHSFQIKIDLPPIDPDPYLVVVRKSSVELLRQINRAIAAMTADGTLERLIGKWL